MPLDLLAAAAVLIAGTCATAMNWHFSYQLGTTVSESLRMGDFFRRVRCHEVADASLCGARVAAA